MSLKKLLLPRHCRLPFKFALFYTIVFSGAMFLILPYMINVPNKPSSSTNTNSSPFQPAKKYVILFWSHGPRMVKRFVQWYGKTDQDYFQDCAYKNCEYRIDNLASLNESDAILIHLHRLKGPFQLPPYRQPHQRWIFFTDESPRNTFLTSRKYKMKDYNGVFNWSMTYRADADVKAAYGRTVQLRPEEIKGVEEIDDYYTKNDKGVAVMGSNCGGDNHRWKFIKEMSMYMDIDKYGHCGDLKCAGSFTTDCPKLNRYKFYLAFENCNCREYITEKLWWNAYAKESIPVVMGALLEDYTKLCPPYSFIHVESFAGPKELADYLTYLMNNQTAYNEYFNWKTNYKVLNEHGYFHTPSKHICHLCEALNEASNVPSVYEDLASYWNPVYDCYKAKWTPES